MPGPDVAREFAAEVRQCLLGDEWLAGPVDLQMASEAADCSLLEERLRNGIEALLLPGPHGFEVIVDVEPRGGWGFLEEEGRDNTARHRLRFRAAHEWAHTFFYERRPGSAPVRRVQNSDAQEEFCDEFARALLVPCSAALKATADAQGALALQERFDCSLEVAVRALAAVHPNFAVWLLVDPDGVGRHRMQWRSDASYDSGYPRAGVIRAANRGNSGELDVVPLPHRRQTLVVARN